MKRFYVCRMLTEGDEESGYERFPYVRAYTEDVNPQCWSDDVTDRAVGQAAFPSLTAVKADPNVFLIDDLPLGVQWSTVPQTRRNEIAAAIRAFGFTFDAHGTWSIKQVIEHLVHQVQPGVDIERADVKDPWG